MTYHEEQYRIPGFYPSHQWKGIRLTTQRCHVMSCSKLWLFPWKIYIVGVHVPMSPNKIPRQSTNDRMPSSATGLRWGLLEPRLRRLIMVDPRMHILFCLERTWKKDSKILEDSLVKMTRKHQVTSCKQSMNPTLMSWWGSHPLTFLPNLHWRQQELPGGATPNLEAGCWHDMLALDSNTDLLTVYAWFLLDRKFFSCR